MKLFFAALLAVMFLVPTPIFASIKPPGTRATATSEWEFSRSTKDFREHFGDQTQEEVLYKKSQEVMVYSVGNDRLTSTNGWAWNDENRKTKTDYRIWEIYRAIAGDPFIKKNIRKYATYKFANEPILAFVVDLEANKGPTWGIAVNANAANFSNNTWVRDLAVTLLHEHGHLLAENGKDIKLPKEKQVCAKKEKNCTAKKPFNEAFKMKFWTAKDTKAAAKSNKRGENEFFKANWNSFVTQYAATNVNEDLAESFTDFVLRKKPTGDKVKDQKILFFYEYPELVKERDRIRSAIVGYLNL